MTCVSCVIVQLADKSGYIFCACVAASYQNPSHLCTCGYLSRCGKILYPWMCVRASCVSVCERVYLSSCTSVISFSSFSPRAKREPAWKPGIRFSSCRTLSNNGLPLLQLTGHQIVFFVCVCCSLWRLLNLIWGRERQNQGITHRKLYVYARACVCAWLEKSQRVCSKQNCLACINVSADFGPLKCPLGAQSRGRFWEGLPPHFDVPFNA